MVNLLKRLTEARGVSGNENAVRDIIIETAKPLADEVYVDKMGNVIAEKKGKIGDKRVMLDAHMDEVGFMISYISDNGMLKFQTVGGIDQRVLLSKRVLIGDDRIPGVIGVKAIHLQERDERNSAIKQKQMYIDIGAGSKEEAEKLVSLGDYVTFDSRFIEFGDNKVKAKALDDRAGCGVLLEVLKGNYDCDIYACFTVQEEIGSRGALVSAYDIEPDLAIVVEGTTCADIPGVPEHIQTTRVGKGPAISHMTSGSISDKGLLKQIVNIAKENQIPYQYREGIAGGNNSAVIGTSKGGVPVTAVCVPCRYIHSPSSVMDLGDYENTIKLIKEFLKGCEVI